MAVGKRESLIKRLTGRDGGRREEYGQESRRIEERQKQLSTATEQWLSLLREMEHAGQSGHPRYESYYQAYLEAKRRQKLIDLELFNLRNGLSR